MAAKPRPFNVSVWRRGDNWTLHINWPDGSWTRRDGLAWDDAWDEWRKALDDFRASDWTAA